MVADRSNPVGRIRSAKHDDSRPLRDWIGGLRRIRQGRTEQHEHLVLKNKLLEDVDCLFFFALLVFDYERELGAVDSAARVNLAGRQLEAVADRHPVLRGVAGQSFGDTDLDIGWGSNSRLQRQRCDKTEYC